MSKQTALTRKLTFACARYFDWFQNKLFSEVFIDGGIADLLFVTRAGYCTEVEIKCTVSDFLRDARKVKWGKHRPHIKRFFFAVPHGFPIDRVLPHMPEGAGLIITTEHGFIHTARPALVNAQALKLSDYDMRRFYAGVHARFWSNYIKQLRDER